MGRYQKGINLLIMLFLVLVFSGIVFSASAQSHDTVVMNMMKKAINAPSSLKWSDLDVCKWNHVQCNSGDRVTAIQIGYLNLQGFLPKELVRLTELKHFECMKNNLNGPFPYMPKSLQILIIHENNFTSIPNGFFKDMTNLREVRIDSNPFQQWQVPSSLKDCVALKNFTAMNVNFVGEIPDFFGNDGPFPSLTNLALSYNFLEGWLPASFSGSSIKVLMVNHQKSNSKFNGTLAVLQNMTSLIQIWAQGNSFTGPIPDLSNLDQLVDVNLRDNQLTGVVPSSLPILPKLHVVSLTNNYLQGSPPKFKDGVTVDDFIVKGNNRFCTEVVGQPCSSLVNDLLSIVEPLGYPTQFADSWQGNDPCANEWVGIDCTKGNISTINFQYMHLSGNISPSFANLKSLTKLILAHNDLTGTIPGELTSLPLLKELDVSNNHLHGQIPSFRKDVVLKINGNPDVGKEKPHAPPSSHSGGKKTGVIIGIVMVVVVLIGVGVLVFITYNRKHMQMRIEEAGDGYGGVGAISLTSNARHVEACNLIIPIQVLRQATNNFDEGNIIGKGGFATVYKGELHDGKLIAVKRMELKMSGDKGLSEFKSEIAIVTKIRHRHLVSLLGYCLDGDEKILVYEYMPLGPLSKYLFYWKDEGLQPLEWKRRLTIALDIARGVEYLHRLAQHVFIHRDLKPSNILLGDNMQAKVADFGLVRLAPNGQTPFHTTVAGTFGYLAPEYAVTGCVTTKVDIYSFGVILMEMITGRKAVDNSQTEENIHIVTYFCRTLLNKDSFSKVIDPAMDVDEEALASINIIAELASHCCARNPNQRPDIGHVVNVLAPHVEIWKPEEPNVDVMYDIDLDMSLSQTLRQWQASKGRTNIDIPSSSSSLLDINALRSAEL